MNFIQAILGTQTLDVFLTNVFFALIGLALSVLVDTSTRNPVSKTSPVHFSWKFFFQDNWKRLVRNILLLFLGLRFSPELLNVEISPMWAVVIGASLDTLAVIIKAKLDSLKSKTSGT